MPGLSRNLLLVAALCWVAPASAQLSGPADDECPDAKASRQIVILADTAPGDVPVSERRRALLP